MIFNIDFISQIGILILNEVDHSLPEQLKKNLKVITDLALVTNNVSDKYPFKGEFLLKENAKDYVLECPMSFFNMDCSQIHLGGKVTLNFIKKIEERYNTYPDKEFRLIGNICDFNNGVGIEKIMSDYPFISIIDYVNYGKTITANLVNNSVK